MWPYYSLSVRGGVPPYEGKLGFQEGRGGKMGFSNQKQPRSQGFSSYRRPGNEVEPEDAQCGNMDVFWSSTFYLLVATLYF